MLTQSFQGLKLREIVVDDTIVLQEMYWGLPHLSPVCNRFEDICRAEPSNHMSVVSCNDPQTTAYSLCWNWEILMLHAHRVGESLDFYQASRTMDEAAIWLYMPLHEGEVLTQIWKFEGELGTAIGLLVCVDSSMFHVQVCSQRTARNGSKTFHLSGNAATAKLEPIQVDSS